VKWKNKKRLVYLKKTAKLIMVERAEDGN